MKSRKVTILIAMALVGGLLAGAAMDTAAAKKKKKKKPKVCKPYVPGEQGAEAETIVVTDAATAEAPLEVTLPIARGVGQATGMDGLHSALAPVEGALTSQQSHAFYNVQVDSKAKEVGLFVSLASPLPDDHDLYLLHSTGTEAAHAAGFYGPVDGKPVYDSNTAGGHTEKEAEVLDGIRTTDCGGYTVHAVGANTRGGDTPLKLWLGDASEYEVPAP